MQDSMRINKFLAQTGIGSRREVDSLIEQGLVRVNNEIATIGQQLKDGDFIQYQNQELIFDLSQKSQLYYYAFNKAKGLVCTCAKDIPNNIIDFLEKTYPELKNIRLYPVGRLDKDSRGLIILTNDGDLSYKLSHPKYEHEKEYLVTCKKKIDHNFIQAFANGLEIREGDENSNLVKTQKCKAQLITNQEFSCVLKQGYNRQIRKMVRVLNNEVLELIRIRIANLKLGKIKENELVQLNHKQVKDLMINC